MRLTDTEIALLHSLAQGSTLKAHRYIDGSKIYRLHPLDDEAVEIERAAVARLKKGGLIDSNKKFPAATYLLTEAGRRRVQQLTGQKIKPLSAKNY